MPPLLLGSVFVAVALVPDGLWAVAAATAPFDDRGPLSATGGPGGLMMEASASRFALGGRN